MTDTPDLTDATPIDDAQPWLLLYRDLSQRITALEEQKAEARIRLEQALGDAETGTVAGKPVVRWTRVTSKRLDQGAAKQLLKEHDLLDAAMVETVSRRFTLVDES